MDLSPDQASQAVISAHASAGREFTSEFCDRMLRHEFKALEKDAGETRSKAQILKTLGIDYSYHSAQPLRALLEMSGYKDKEFFSRIIVEMDRSGVDLSDNDFNSADEISIHEYLPDLTCALCKDCTPLKAITKRSVYAKCRKVFGSWAESLSASGVSLDRHQRKVAARNPEAYLQELFRIFASDQEWSVATIRHNPAAWGLRHERNQQPLVLYNSNVAPELVRDGKWVFAAWVQFKALEQGAEPVTFYKDNYPTLWAEYQEKHMRQEEWSPGRLEAELHQAFAEGRRITRYELASSEHEFDRKLLAASRAVRHRSSGIDHNDHLLKAGFLPKILASIYAEEDDKWTRIKCFKESQKLMQIHLDTGQPTLSREWCRLNAREFHDALLRKVHGKSWESGLRWIGLDPKKFAIHASPRTKRGLVFQDFFKDQLILHGFKEVESEVDLANSLEFVAAKSVPGCPHDVQCRPDFLFRDFIIDTKTGIGAVSPDNDQLQRYCDHRNVVYLLTLNNKHSERSVGNGIVVTFSFKEFVACSGDLLGVQLAQDLPARLTAVLDQVLER